MHLHSTPITPLSAAPRPDTSPDASKRRGPDRSPPPQLLLSPEDAARSLSVSRAQIYRLLASGELSSITIGRVRRIRVSDLEAFIRRREEERPA